MTIALVVIAVVVAGVAVAVGVCVVLVRRINAALAAMHDELHG